MLLHQQERQLTRLVEDCDQSCMDTDDYETIYLFQNEARMARRERAKVQQRQRTIRTAKEAVSAETTMPMPNDNAPDWDPKEMSTFFGKPYATASEALTAFKHHFTHIPGNSSTIYRALSTALPGEARETWFKLTDQHPSIGKAVKQMATMYMVKKTVQESARDLHALTWDGKSSFTHFMAQWEILYYETHGNGVNPHMEKPEVKEAAKQQTILTNVTGDLRAQLDEAMWRDRARGRIWNSADMVRWIHAKNISSTKPEILAINAMRATPSHSRSYDRSERGRSRERRHMSSTKDGSVRKPSQDARDLSRESRRKFRSYLSNILSSPDSRSQSRERSEPMDTSSSQQSSSSSSGYNGSSNRDYRTKQGSSSNGYNSSSSQSYRQPQQNYSSSSGSHESRSKTPNGSYNSSRSRTPNGSWADGRSRSRTPNGSRRQSQPPYKGSRSNSQQRSQSQNRKYSDGAYKAGSVKRGTSPDPHSHYVLEANAKLHVNNDDKEKPQAKSNWAKGNSNSSGSNASNK